MPEITHLILIQSVNHQWRCARSSFRSCSCNESWVHSVHVIRTELKSKRKFRSVIWHHSKPSSLLDPVLTKITSNQSLAVRHFARVCFCKKKVKEMRGMWRKRVDGHDQTILFHCNDTFKISYCLWTMHHFYIQRKLWRNHQDLMLCHYLYLHS